MKYIAIIVLFVAIIIGFSAGCSNNGIRGNALTINDIKGDPMSFTGKITITGIVAGFNQTNPNIFFVVDTAELLACKNLGCGAYRLPAFYRSGSSMPKIADEVLITGQWQKQEIDSNNRKQMIDVFTVSKIDVKRNIMDILRQGNN